MISKVGAKNAIAGAVDRFEPGYFAMVMATGIVSVACSQQGMKAVSILLFHLNEAVYAAFLAIALARCLFSRFGFLDDLADYSRAPGYFAVVAGTCVLGVQFAVLNGDLRMAAALWCLAAVLWFLLFYGFFAAIAVRQGKSGSVAMISGEWLLLVVSTQSVSILGSLTDSFVPAANGILLFVALCFFLLGSLLYLLVITAVLYRLLFIGLAPADLAPSYWICMGAAAISTLAGVTLVGEAYRWQLLGGIVPVLTGASLFFWVVAGWWIPSLIILGARSHLRVRAPLFGASRYWSLVFPLGMYSACTFQLEQVTGLWFLSPVSSLFNYLGLLAWLVTFLAALRSGIRVIRQCFSGSDRLSDRGGKG